MSQGRLSALSVLGASTSVALSHVAQIVSILAGVVAILAALPVVCDRWGPFLRRFLGKAPPGGGAALFALCAALLSLSLSGCFTTSRAARSPALKVSTPTGGTVEQTGDASAPAEVSTSRQSATLPLPAGSAVHVIAASPAGPARVEIGLADASTLSTETTGQTVKGPAAFTPPAPPTARETAIAGGIRGAWALGGVLLVLALVLAWRGHGKAAGLAFIGAALAPMAANFLSSTAGAVVGAVAVSGAVSLFAAWHLMEWRKKKAAEHAAALGRNASPAGLPGGGG